MTVDGAVKVLNEHKHNNHSKWYVWGEPERFARGIHQREILTRFEAVAIAEKYLRDDELERAKEYDRVLRPAKDDAK